MDFERTNPIERDAYKNFDDSSELQSDIRFDQVETRLLRQQQDDEYLQCLREDQEREQRKTQKLLDIEKLLANLCLDEEEHQKKKEEFVKMKEPMLLAIEEELSKLCLEKHERDRQKEQLDKMRKEKAPRIPVEPPAGLPELAHLAIRLPNGERIMRRFRHTDKLKDVFDFIFCYPNAPDWFDISVPLPRRDLHCEGSTVSLLEAGLVGKHALIPKRLRLTTDTTALTLRTTPSEEGLDNRRDAC
ncbi:Hypothetical predicted protein [Cloeon dipterum]|uniref:UBX domain-containing protein n=1 Tax=Cloeon dipterum TaxID=197152 RepID=A0A8S1D5U3_9INSE|nr:Hypothetical predicted protein [Cloeon dipterum]